MKKNPSMTDEDWRWFQLSCKVHELPVSEIEEMEKQLQLNPEDMDLRAQLFAYYSKHEGNDLKHVNAEQKIFEYVKWLIENKPSLKGWMGSRNHFAARLLTPKHFAVARNIWLELIDADPDNADILGNAGAFISWIDFETGAELTERAYKLQPSEYWLGPLAIHCAAKVWNCPSIYKEKLQRKLINIGLRSLKTETKGARFLIAEYVADAALALGQYDAVRYCAQVMYDWNLPSTVNDARTYLTLLALRDGDREPALRLMSEPKRSHLRVDMVFTVASELFKLGERDSIVHMIKSLKGKTKKHSRERWLAQIADNKQPDFIDSRN